jgi:hypothetical protein
MAEEQLKLEAQEALDELWNEKRLPFKLTAYHVDPVEDVLNFYQINFFDSRLQPMIVEWKQAYEPFKSAVRTAVDGWAVKKNLDKRK